MTLRELSALLLVFCLFSLVIHLDILATAFGGMAVVFYAADFVLSRVVETRVAKMRREPLL